MTTTALPKPYTRLSELLPSLKAIAILWIVVYHIWAYTKGYLKFSEITDILTGNGVKGLVEGFLNLFCSMGEHGVHIFLIASGFGLATSWWKSYQKTPGNNNIIALIPFWKRRWLGFLIIFWALGLACDWGSESGLMAWRIPADLFLGIGEFFALFQIINYLPSLKPWLNPVGDTSYGIYLIHMNLETGLWIGMGFISFYWLRLFVVVAIACFLGGLFDLAGNWIIKQGLKNNSFSSPK